MAEVNTSGAVLRRYVPGPGTDEPIVWYEGSGTTDARFLHADERGSVIAVTNASGTTIATNAYDEYGIPASGNVGRFQYTGQAWLPEIGLAYYKARMYSPSLGRFMQTDPIGYADGLNWYNYVGSDPVNSIDPSGLGLCPEGSHPVYTSGGSGSGETHGADVTVTIRYHCEADTSSGNSGGTRFGNNSGNGGVTGGPDIIVRARKNKRPQKDPVFYGVVPPNYRPQVKYPPLPNHKQRCAFATGMGGAGTLGQVGERVATRLGLQVVPGVNVVVDIITAAGVLMFFFGGVPEWLKTRGAKAFIGILLLVFRSFQSLYRIFSRALNLCG